MTGWFTEPRCRRAPWQILAVAMLAPSPAAAADVDFNRDVLPILSTNCFPCHGPDGAKRKADFRLDDRKSAIAGRAIFPGKPEASALLARVTAEDDDDRMPPAKAGARLRQQDVELLRSWINEGAPYTEHWAFVPPVRPPIPKVPGPPVSNPVDAFILASLERAGLKAALPASREVLLRRVTIDLTGLPPTTEEIEAFRKDDSSRAWEKVIDRLLASPRYGERWGRHWLDVVRYADSGGFETDIFFGSAWRYRDYVIRSFNSDKPFDQFVKEQIAGDELLPGDRNALVATGLYAVGPVLQEANMVPRKLDYDWLTDAVDTTGSAFLGMTVGCARCHDHKYDPVSQKEYFGLQAIFARSDLTDYKTDGTILRNHVALTKTETEFEKARKRDSPRKEAADYDEYPEIPLRGLGPRTERWKYEVQILRRGELSAAGEMVNAALPGKLAGILRAFPHAKGRAALADWIASRDNPLTARIIVNRVWQWHFGEGLVRTPNDFGVRGERPTDPNLLDWLAVEFMESGWSLKKLHRRILLSDAYRMSSIVDADTLRLDPENRLLTRFQPRRVEAEVVWDAMRVAAGTLDRRMYGLPVFPQLDERELIGNYRKWVAGTAGDANRRAVYIVARRSFRFPALGAFDPPDNASSCGRRDRTVVPNQALTLLNNRSVRDQAGAFASRLIRETDGTMEAIIARAWLIAYGRPISKAERIDAVAFLRDRENEAPGATDPLKTAVTELCVALFNTNEFIYVP